MITFTDVHFSYKDARDSQLDIPSLTVKDGECVLLTGISGSGKSTVTKCINGLIPEFFEGTFSGNVYINEYNLETMPVYEISRHAASVFQDPSSQFFTESIITELAFACENYGIEREDIKRRMERAVQTVRIEHLLHKRLSALSNGEKQKTAIASVLTMQPSVILLDEPSSNLDYASILTLKEIIRTLKQQGMTVIVAEHRIYYLAELFDRVLYIQDGKIGHEYSAEEFRMLSTHELHTMGLRSLEVFSHTGEAVHTPCREDDGACVPALRFERISYSYKDSGKPVLRDVDFELYTGEVTALAGRNGIGKTTLARIAAGLYTQESGAVYINGKESSAKERIAQVQFVMNDSDYQLFGDSVYNELLIGNAGSADVPQKAEAVLERLNLHSVRDAHPMSLSGGQKQRLVIAASYMKNAVLTVLDEPTSGLDYRNMLQVSALLKNLAEDGKAVLIISHDYEFLVHTCARVLFLTENGIEHDIRLSKQPDMLKELFTNRLQ